MALGLLEKRGYAGLKQEPPRRTKMLLLTAKSRQAAQRYSHLTETIEEQWRSRFGEQIVRELRARLELLALEDHGQPPPLFRGLEPYPAAWRAKVPRPRTLPHFPMILHRGGYPDRA